MSDRRFRTNALEEVFEERQFGENQQKETNK
jgi:hypothetical protein